MMDEVEDGLIWVPPIDEDLQEELSADEQKWMDTYFLPNVNNRGRDKDNLQAEGKKDASEELESSQGGFPSMIGFSGDGKKQKGVCFEPQLSTRPGLVSMREEMVYSDSDSDNGQDEMWYRSQSKGRLGDRSPQRAGGGPSNVVTEDEEMAERSLNYYDRRAILDEVADYLLNSSRADGKARNTTVFLNVLSEQMKLDNLEAEQQRKRLDPISSMPKASKKHQMKSQLQEILVNMVKSKNENFRGYCLDDAEEMATESTFLRIVLDGDLEKVLEFVDRCSRQDMARLTNWKNHLGQTVLHRVARLSKSKVTEEHDRIIHILGEMGASPKALDSLGWSPLVYAMETGAMRIIRALIEIGAPLDQVDDPILAQSTLSAIPRSKLSPQVLGVTLKSHLVADAHDLAFEERSVLQWSSVFNDQSSERVMSRFLQTLVFLRFDSPKREGDGFQPLCDEKVSPIKLKWISKLKVHRYDVYFHVIGTLSSVASMITSTGPKGYTEVMSNLSNEAIIRIASRMIHENVIKDEHNFLDSKRRSSSVESVESQVFSGFSQSNLFEHGWNLDTSNKYHFEKLYTELIGNFSDCSCEWKPPPNLMKTLPKNSLCIFEVKYSKNPIVCGISDVFPFSKLEHPRT